MHVALFLLSVSFFFAQNSFSSAPLSGLDLLASVALDADCENVLQVSDVDGLCSRFTDRGSLFKHIFALLQLEDYFNFQNEVQASLLNLLVKTSKLQRTSASSSSSTSANSDFHRQSDWKLLRDGHHRPNMIVSDFEFYEAIRRRLVAEGPESIRALIELHPDYLDQSNFLFNLRVVLKNYLSSIAQIYSGNIEKTRKLFPYIRAQLQDPILYSTFVFELMRINPDHRFHLAYVDCLIGRSADDFSRMTALHDYSRLSLKNLILSCAACPENSPSLPRSSQSAAVTLIRIKERFRQFFTF